MFDRRSVLAGIAGAFAARDGLAQAPEAKGGVTLTAGPLAFSPREGSKPIEAWGFDGRVPAEPIRVAHGEEVRVRLENGTPRALSLHWHGVRNASPMDGVGGLTQAPVPPGGSFDYRFTPPDPGTFLIRPLIAGGGSGEAAERGLGGLLIVEEKEAPPVDRELALVVDDWHLTEAGDLAPFGGLAETAGLGRLGGLVTVNGSPAPFVIEAPPGARLRLRLANACNARIVPIRFEGLRAFVGAVDGQPTDTFEPLRSTLPFSPGSRYDLYVELPAEARSEGRVVGLAGNGLPLVRVRAVGQPAERGRPPLPPIAPLKPNPLLPPAIRLQAATRPNAVIAGGARVGPDGQASFSGDPKRIWTINGATGAAANPPLFRVKRGAPVVLAIVNQTPFAQPMHLHGHGFRLLHPYDDGWEPFWLDTLPIPAGRTVRIAFNADNPGRWALSSTVLERFDTGLWSWFEVT